MITTLYSAVIDASVWAKKERGGEVKLNVSLKRRIKQFFCKHDRGVGLGCASKGINAMDGHWFVNYRCGRCGFAYGEWIKADKDTVEKLFEKETHKIK